MIQTYTGIIIEGSKTARALGFPTANIKITPPIAGIFAGTVAINGKEYRAALFGDAGRSILEAYILDFSENVYGKLATYTLLEKIREHETFTDSEILRKQIARDVEKTREYFTTSPS